MVTLSVTRSRIAGVLADAEALLRVEGWDPFRNSIIHVIDRAAGFVPGSGNTDAEQTTLNAWELLARHLDVASVSDWERTPGRTQLQVVSALHGATTGAVTW